MKNLKDIIAAPTFVEAGVQRLSGGHEWYLRCAARASSNYFDDIPFKARYDECVILGSVARSDDIMTAVQFVLSWDSWDKLHAQV